MKFSKLVNSNRSSRRSSLNEARTKKIVDLTIDETDSSSAEIEFKSKTFDGVEFTYGFEVLYSDDSHPDIWFYIDAPSFEVTRCMNELNDIDKRISNCKSHKEFEKLIKSL